MDVAYQDVLNKFNSTREAKGLKVTQGNLVVMWKVRPQMDIISKLPLGLRWFSRGDDILVPFLPLIFQFVPNMRRKI